MGIIARIVIKGEKMTKEEYQEFSLRYKGCGACFPIFEKLTRLEKMWFTAIQKNVTDLEEENEKLKNKNKALELYADLAEKKVDESKELIKKLVYEYERLCLIKKETLTEVEQFLKGEL